MLKLDISKLFLNRLAVGEKQAHLENDFWFTMFTKKEDIAAIPQKIKSAANKKVSGFFDASKTNIIYIGMRPKTSETIQVEEIKLKFIKLVKSAILSNPDNENTMEESVVDIDVGKGDKQEIYLFAGFEIEY